MTAAVQGAVRALYERFPYPPSGDAPGYPVFAAMDYVRHVLWPEREGVDGLRVLDAGCGTGHTVVQLARDFPGLEVTGMDLSEASLEAARERARQDGVGDRVRFCHGSIEAPAVQGPFDYIICSGVLHHLADPLGGARRLAGLLAPHGGMGLMVYATHGRHAVYLLQELLRRIDRGEALDARIGLARELVRSLPASHPYQPARWSEHDWRGDAGIADLLLHPRDVSFTVAELQELIVRAGLRQERWFAPPTYEPERYLPPGSLRSRLAALPAEDKPMVAELLHGGMIQHRCFVTSAGYRPLRLPPLGPVLLRQRPRLMVFFDWSAGRMERREIGGETIDVWVLPHWSAEGPPIVLTLEAWSREVLRWCDGSRSGIELLDVPAVRAAVPGSGPQAQLGHLGRLFEFAAREEVLLFS